MAVMYRDDDRNTMSLGSKYRDVIHALGMVLRSDGAPEDKSKQALATLERYSQDDFPRIALVNEAVCAGDPDACRFLLQFVDNLDFLYGNISPLGIAAERLDIDMMEMLLDAGASPDGWHAGLQPIQCLFGLAKGIAGFRQLSEKDKQRQAECLKALIGRGVNVTWFDGYRKTPLRDAVRAGNEHCVKLLLDAGTDLEGGVKANGEDNESILHFAAQYSDAAIIRVLHGHGADVHAQAGPAGHTPLHEAAQRGRDGMIDVLLELGADLDAPDYNGNTPLHYAMLNGMYSKAGELVAAGADVDKVNDKGISPVMRAAVSRENVPETLTGAMLSACDPSKAGSAGRTVLHFAAAHGAALNLLLSAQPDADVNAADLHGRTPLHYVVMNAGTDTVNDDCIDMLLERGADIEATDQDGNTPLLAALERGHVKRAMYLHKKGASLSAINAENGKGTLHFAARYCDSDAVKWLLEEGLSASFADDDGGTPLYDAVCHGDEQHKLPAVIAMLESSANPNVMTLAGDTVLNAAIRHMDMATVDKLIAAGADVNFAGAGDTPLYTAVQHDKQGVVTALLQQRDKPDINSCNTGGNTPLHGAAVNGRPAATRSLIKAGAELDKVNSKGWTPLQEALAESQFGLVDMLLRAGAKHEFDDLPPVMDRMLAAARATAGITASGKDNNADLSDTATANQRP